MNLSNPKSPGKGIQLTEGEGEITMKVRVVPSLTQLIMMIICKYVKLN